MLTTSLIPPPPSPIPPPPPPSSHPPPAAPVTLPSGHRWSGTLSSRVLLPHVDPVHHKLVNLVPHHSCPHSHTYVHHTRILPLQSPNMGDKSMLKYDLLVWNHRLIGDTSRDVIVRCLWPWVWRKSVSFLLTFLSLSLCAGMVPSFCSESAYDHLHTRTSFVCKAPWRPILFTLYRFPYYSFLWHYEVSSLQWEACFYFKRKCSIIW